MRIGISKNKNEKLIEILLKNMIKLERDDFSRSS
jgi:hypothetical protein